MSTTTPPAPDPTELGNSRSGLLWVCMLLGLAAFLLQLFTSHPDKAWQAYLTNFLLFSAIAQGGLLFSVVMHITKARWSGPLASLGEAFSAFFPLSIGLFLLLYIGKEHVFPWLHMDLHGKEVWLNVPFLFGRDLGALLLLYFTGLLYLYHGLWFKIGAHTSGQPAGGGIQRWLLRRWKRHRPDDEAYRRRQMFFALLYALFFALVLSLIGYDLVMAMDPHWYSTLFGAYSFVKAFYVGLGAIIIAAALLQARSSYTVTPEQYHDIGKLFFAFCLVWADFFYAQFVVIWYGNISEETSYIIQRTMTAPWNVLAWAVLVICFIGPFIILLNQRIKTRPRAMLVICSIAIAGIWLEHKLLIGPAFAHGGEAVGLPFNLVDFFVPLGFLGLMARVVSAYLKQFPQLFRPEGAAIVEEVA
jgi:Ni/Fe-hydrogenase subunit HybB-like protein